MALNLYRSTVHEVVFCRRGYDAIEFAKGGATAIGLELSETAVRRGFHESMMHMSECVHVKHRLQGLCGSKGRKRRK